MKFNFELQAAATEDAIVLSLSTSHSFELATVARYLHSATVRDVLIQAMLDAPMFAARWRWIAGHLAGPATLSRRKKIAAPLQRMRADDLMAAVFPDQIACAENIVGAREIPDHPLVNQAVHDCLHEAMDVDGLEALLRGIESGAIEVVARDLPMPSPLALEILTARPYAYLDDAPLKSAARRRSSRAAGWMMHRPNASPAWTLRRSRASARKPGPMPRRQTNCTTRCSRLDSSPWRRWQPRCRGCR